MRLRLSTATSTLLLAAVLVCCQSTEPLSASTLRRSLQDVSSEQQASGSLSGAAPTPTCAPGWRIYLDTGKTEGKKSCLKYVNICSDSYDRGEDWCSAGEQSPPGTSTPDWAYRFEYTITWAAANYHCSQLHTHAHLVTIKSKVQPTVGGRDLLSAVIDYPLPASASNYNHVWGYAGCSQDSSSTPGLGKTGTGWTWLDGTSAANLVCANPKITTNNWCPNTVWVRGREEPRDDNVYPGGVSGFEYHYDDVCVYWEDGDQSAARGVGAWSDGTVSSFMCEYEL